MDTVYLLFKMKKKISNSICLNFRLEIAWVSRNSATRTYNVSIATSSLVALFCCWWAFSGSGLASSSSFSASIGFWLTLKLLIGWQYAFARSLRQYYWWCSFASSLGPFSSLLSLLLFLFQRMPFHSLSRSRWLRSMSTGCDEDAAASSVDKRT